MRKFVLVLSWLYLAALLVAWALLHFGSEYWWPVTILLFAPRWMLAAPLLLLLPMVLLVRRRLAPLFALHLAILLFPIMGLELRPFAGGDEDATRFRLCVVSCNVGGGEPRLDRFVGLLKEHSAHVVMLQECEWDVANEIFGQLEWQFQHDGGLAIGSRYPLGAAETVVRHGSQRYHKPAALACTVELERLLQETDSRPHRPGSEPLLLVNVHLPTVRPALARLIEDPFSGAPNLPEVIDEHARVSGEASEWVRRQNARTIVAGDFNMPTASTLYRSHWGHLQNAWEIAGAGFGHTKFTRIHGVRIDHVLADDSWSAIAAEVGPGVGGDHRPVIATWAPAF